MAGSSLLGNRKGRHADPSASARSRGFLAQAVECLDLYQVASAMVACQRSDCSSAEVHDAEPQIPAPPAPSKAIESEPRKHQAGPEKQPARIQRSKSEASLLGAQLDAQLGNVVDALSGKPPEGAQGAPKPSPEAAQRKAAAPTPSVAQAAALLLDDAGMLAAGKEPQARRKVAAPSESVVVQSALVLDDVRKALDWARTAHETPSAGLRQDQPEAAVEIKKDISDATAQGVGAVLESARKLADQAIADSPAKDAPAPGWDVQVKALVAWYSSQSAAKGKKNNPVMIQVAREGCDLSHLMRMGEIVGRDPSINPDHAAFMAIRDVAQARSLAIGFDERLKGEGPDALPILSYEFARMLQIRSQSDRLGGDFIAMELIREMRGEPLVSEKGPSGSPFISNALPIKRILGKMHALARVVLSGGLIGIPHASSDCLSKEEERRLLEAYQKAPIPSLAIIRNGLMEISDPDERLEFVRASVALELTLDSVIWQPDNIVRDSVPNYIMHGFYDFGEVLDRRERLKADKFAFARHLVDVKSKALDLIADGSRPEGLMDRDEQIAVFLVGPVKSHVNDQNKDGRGAPPPGAMNGGNRTIGANAYFDNGGGLYRHNTLIYSLFLQELGMPNLMLKGTVDRNGVPMGRHAINALRLGSKWYAIDITQGITSPHHIPVNLDHIDIRTANITLPFHYGNFKLDLASNKWAVKEPHATPIGKK